MFCPQGSGHWSDFPAALCSVSVTNISGSIKKGRRKIHTCNICKKTFKKKDHLQEHHLKHSGEKPHLCPICFKCFTRKRNIKTHIAMTHPQVPFAHKFNLKN